MYFIIQKLLIRNEGFIRRYTPAEKLMADCSFSGPNAGSNVSTAKCLYISRSAPKEKPFPKLREYSKPAEMNPGFVYVLSLYAVDSEPKKGLP